MNEAAPSLLCRVGAVRAALPLKQVVEIMRPLLTRAMASAPPFVLGVSVIRGVAVPVLDLSMLLLGAPATAVTRFVCLRLSLGAGERVVAVAVDHVEGVRVLSPAELGAMPSLLEDVEQPLLRTLGTLDRELCLVLQQSLRVPDSLWQALAEEAQA